MTTFEERLKELAPVMFLKPTHTHTPDQLEISASSFYLKSQAGAVFCKDSLFETTKNASHLVLKQVLRAYTHMSTHTHPHTHKGYSKIQSGVGPVGVLLAGGRP